MLKYGITTTIRRNRDFPGRNRSTPRSQGRIRLTPVSFRPRSEPPTKTAPVPNRPLPCKDGRLPPKPTALRLTPSRPLSPSPIASPTHPPRPWSQTAGWNSGHLLAATDAIAPLLVLFSVQAVRVDQRAEKEPYEDIDSEPAFCSSAGVERKPSQIHCGKASVIAGGDQSGYRSRSF